MRSTITSLAFAAIAAAAPLTTRQASTNIDGVILNYALTLEHLEDTFYKLALNTLSEEDFLAAGLGKSFYSNLQEISKDEATHVSFLTTALGAAGVPAVVANEYSFGFTDVPSFLALASVFEGLGVSAYLGAASFITNKAYLTAAGSILTVEARHSSYLRSKQNPALSPFPAPFDVPTSFNQTYSLAAQFITKNNNPDIPLPVVAFPAISVAPAQIHQVGDVLSLTVATSVDAKAAYFITYPGGPIEATLTGSGTSYQVTVPAAAQPGQAYLVLTSGAAPTDENTVAGPAAFEVADNAFGVVDNTPCTTAAATTTAAPKWGHKGKGEHHNATTTSCETKPTKGSGLELHL